MDTLIATNDFHSAVPTGRALLSALRGHRARGAWVVDGGDFFGGNSFHEFSAGRVEQGLLAELYDAIVPGNHDLVDLMRLEAPDRCPPVVCANVRPPQDFRGRWESALLLPARERRVGIVGYMGCQAFEAIPPAERAGFAYEEPTADLIARERDRLLSAGADVVVGVSHSGFAHDVADQQGDWPLALVVAAHCHSAAYHWAEAGRHVVKAPENGAGLLRLDLTPDGGRRFTVETFPSTPLPKPDGLEEAVTAYEAWGAEPIGSVRAALPTRDEVALAVTERARAAVGSDAFVLNLGCLRSGLPTAVTRQALIDCAPFDADLVLLDGMHGLRDVLDQVRGLKEEPVSAHGPAAAPSTGCVIATTRYLAARLHLPIRSTTSPRTLRGVLTDLVQEES